MRIPENLPAHTVALIRLPVPVFKIRPLCELFADAEHLMEHRGDWIVITRKGGKAS